ncbi:MAG: cation-translocating P-type ATPase [Candidatus Methylacidiphilales bacterium]|nr:cation-translocating P-type ATPase [Candidatus Methylacidiphilales bacterium]
MSSCCGTPVSPMQGHCVEDRKEQARHWLRLGLAALIAGQSMVFSLAVNLDRPESASYLILHGLLALAALAVFLLVGLPMARTAWSQARRGRAAIEQFFLAGVLAAFGASVVSSLTRTGSVYYEVVSVLLAIYSLGRLVGERQRRHVLAAASGLRRDFDTCVRLDDRDGEETVPVAAISRGDRVRVRAGSGVPVDGQVEEGTAWVSETPLNGEPFPMVRRAGDLVRAGGQVIDAALIVRAQHDGHNREIDRLLGSVEATLSLVSPLQREADRVVAWFLPVVLVLALLTGGFWAWQLDWTTGLFRGLAVLVVACPCALGLATPIALWGAANRLARQGLVPRRGDFVERLAGIDRVVFDKTGTLSEEHLQVVDWVSAPGTDRRLLEAEVAAIQDHMDHPVARAFRVWPKSKGVVVEGGVRVMPACGVAARVVTPQGIQEVELGNETLLQPGDSRLVDEWKEALSSPGLQACRWVVIRRNGVLAGLALLRENLRASAPGVLADLRALGVGVAVMTGDRPGAAEALGLTAVHAGLSAEDKASLVREWQEQGHKVLLVGDGVNDAPAMAAAQASVALVSGSALGRETADAEMFGNDLGRLAEAIRMSRRVVRRIRQNLAIAAVYNFLGIGLAMAGWLHPVAAAVLMLASSLTVSSRALLGLEDTESGEKPVRQDKRIGGENFRRQRLAAMFAAGALSIQGAALVYLGGYTGLWATALLGGFLLAGLLLWSQRQHWLNHPFRTAFVIMVVAGNAGMLAGWWGDAGWGPAVRDGLCLCGCSPGHFVEVLKGTPGWMHLGMVAGALPGFWWDARHRSKPRHWDWLWLVCLAFMWLGMQGGAWAVMGWFPGRPQWQLLASFSAMTAGMFLAMLVVCGPRLWDETRERASS